MKLTDFIISILVAATICCMTTSCCSDNTGGSGYPDNMATDFATLASTSDRGTVFTLQKSGDSPLVTFTAPIKIDQSVIKVGERVIIAYVPDGGQKVYESGPIKLYGILAIFNADITTEPMSTIENWSSQRMDTKIISRSGNYLDIWAELEYKTEPERFVLAVDESTVNDEYPEVYLVFTSDLTTLGPQRQFYASFDLSPVWDLQSCRGLNIHYMDKTGDKTLKIEKETHQISDPDKNVRLKVEL